MSLTTSIFASTLVLVSFGRIAFAQDTCRDPYANQTIQWIDCGVSDQPTLQCATLDVPLDYTDLSVGTLNLPVVRVPASVTPDKGSIFTNPGGPGASGIEDIVNNGLLIQNITGKDYHIVSFDPRGVGLSTPYTCPTLIPVTGASLPLNSSDGLNATYITNVNQGLYCNQSEYRQASMLVGTAFVARDLMSIVNALGEDGMIRYWGSSYGTLLGATIAAMFPDKIDRMILDGNINPTDYYHGLNEESVDDADAAQSNFFAACVSAGNQYCALATGDVTGPQLEQQYLDWLQAQVNNPKYQSLKGYLFGNLKYPSTWPDTAQTLYNVMSSSGDPSTVKRAAPFDPLAATSDAGNGFETLSAITCGDWDDVPGNGTLKDFEDWLELYTTRSPHNGDMLISILYACATWKVNAKEKYAGSFENIQTKTPILFINGHLDPVTPLVSAVNSSSGFVNSGVLETNIAGHCSSAQRSSCVTDKIFQYFSDGKLPSLRGNCEPDTPAFIPMDEPIRNITDGTGSNTTYHERRFEHDPNFEYPAMLQGVKRDVYSILLEKRDAAAASSTLPNCTSLATGTGSSAAPKSTGSSGTSNGAVARGVGIGVGGVVVTVIVGALAVL